MTYGRDAQPAIRSQNDGLARGLSQHETHVKMLAREIRFEIGCIRRSDHPERIAAGKTWIKDAWGARRSAQQNVIAYRGLIAERDVQNVLGLAG